MLARSVRRQEIGEPYDKGEEQLPAAAMDERKEARLLRDAQPAEKSLQAKPAQHGDRQPADRSTALRPPGPDHDKNGEQSGRRPQDPVAVLRALVGILEPAVGIDTSVGERPIRKDQPGVQARHEPAGRQQEERDNHGRPRAAAQPGGSRFHRAGHVNSPA